MLSKRCAQRRGAVEWDGEGEGCTERRMRWGEEFAAQGVPILPHLRGEGGHHGERGVATPMGRPGEALSLGNPNVS